MGPAVLAAVLLGSLGGSDPPEDPAGCEVNATTGGVGTDGAGTDGGGSGACGVPPQEPGQCGNPGFEDPSSLPATPIPVTCSGEADGVIHYKVRTGLYKYETRQAPGAQSPVAFPSEDATVEACCALPEGDPMAEDTALDGCAYDCGRAVCNEVLARLAARIALADPSNGACDPLVDPPFGVEVRDACRERTRQSLQTWFDDLKKKDTYDQCVTTATANADPDVDYWDPGVPVNQVPLADPPCVPEEWGCLYDAVLRPYCAVDGQMPRPDETCTEAANPDLSEPEDPGGGGGTVGGPGDVSALGRSWPVEVVGGRIAWSCGGPGCAVALEDLRVVAAGELEVAPWLRVRNLRARLVRPLRGTLYAGGVAVLGAADGRIWVDGEAVLGAPGAGTVVPFHLRWSVDGPVVVELSEGGVRLVHVPLARDGRSATLSSGMLPLEGEGQGP